MHISRSPATALLALLLASTTYSNIINHLPACWDPCINNPDDKGQPTHRIHSPSNNGKHHADVHLKPAICSLADAPRTHPDFISCLIQSCDPARSPELLSAPFRMLHSSCNGNDYLVPHVAVTSDADEIYPDPDESSATEIAGSQQQTTSEQETSPLSTIDQKVLHWFHSASTATKNEVSGLRKRVPAGSSDGDSASGSGESSGSSSSSSSSGGSGKGSSSSGGTILDACSGAGAKKQAGSILGLSVWLVVAVVWF